MSGVRGSNSQQEPRRGLTAVEVIVSTMLASMLMVAVLGVLRGLKSQEAALDVRMPAEVWQRTLDAVLQHDLENSRSYELTARSLLLKGFGGRDVETGSATWEPATIVYEIVEDGHRTWLARGETTTAMPSGQGPRELVLADVSSIRAGVTIDLGESVPTPLPSSTRREMPISDGLVLEFWSANGGPVYGYRFRRP